MTAPQAADLTVLVSAIVRTDGLPTTLRSLERQTTPGFAIKVLVHADASVDEPASDTGIELFRIETRDLIRGHDLAVRSVTTPYVLVLSQGLEAAPDLVQAHLAAHGSGDVAVSGTVEWHPSITNRGINRWFARNFDSGFDGAPVAMNVSFKAASYLAGPVGSDLDFGGDEASLVVRLRRAEIELRHAHSARAFETRHISWSDILQHAQVAARTESEMSDLDPSFVPATQREVVAASHRRPVSQGWVDLADRLPQPLSALAERRAGLWYHQQIADAFLDAWEGRRDFAELRAYLGDRYDHAQLVHHTSATEDEEEAAGDEAEFYRTSETYLYDLTVFAMSGTKAPYRRVIRSLVVPGARLLDYGCGLGSDGLRLLEDGYVVEFADFDNPGTRFLRWRLEQRGLRAPIHDVDVEVPGGFDLAYCFDVIEHIEDPVAFLEELESKTAIVVVNFLEPTPDDVHLHKHLDVPALVDRAAKLGLLWYRRYHTRSHLVAYRTPGQPKVNPALSAGRRWTGKHRAPRACEPRARS